MRPFLPVTLIEDLAPLAVSTCFLGGNVGADCWRHGGRRRSPGRNRLAGLPQILTKHTIERGIQLYHVI